MEANLRQTLLLADIKDEEVDELAEWWSLLSATLPVRALWLLLRVADQDGTWVFDPIGLHLNRDCTDKYPLSFVMSMSHHTHSEIHYLTHLEALGLLEKQETENGWEFMLTQRGMFAVTYWLDQMEDLAMSHETLLSLTQWLLRNNPSTTNS